MPDFVDRVLDKLAVLIREGRFEGLESDGLEIKPVPAAGQEWRERLKSANAFLNTRGGVILFGIREEGQGSHRRYAFTGYREEAEDKLKTFPAEFTDRLGGKLDLREAFPEIQLREFMGGRVAVMFVDELPADRKFVFYRGEAWKRILCLILKAGPLLGEPMKTTLAGFDGYIEKRNGGALSEEQSLVLAYLMKSEEANRRQHYSILLTPDNNHFEQLLKLEQAGLIQKHPRSTAIYPIYLAERVLMQADYRTELEALFGETLSTFDPTTRECLNVLYRHGRFSRIKQVTAKMAAFAIWYATKGQREDIRGFDRFYRKIRQIFKNLEEARLIIRSEVPKRVGYQLNPNYQAPAALVR